MRNLSENMRFIQVSFKVAEEYSDILIAELNEAGYDSFATDGDNLEAFVAKENFNEQNIIEILEKYKEIFPVDYSWAGLDEKNWNEEWEKNFEPVFIGRNCVVRASFHKLEKAFPYEIIINPKMSFGTGHHETTSLMIENMLEIDHKSKRVMDAGSGTGILAIMAEKLDASEILAFDIEDWAYNNMLENFRLNECTRISGRQGTIREVNPEGSYNIILANINKNVLMEELPLYRDKLSFDGRVLLSGFYLQDIPDLQKKAETAGLKIIKENSKNNWACLLLSCG